LRCTSVQKCSPRHKVYTTTDGRKRPPALAPPCRSGPSRRIKTKVENPDMAGLWYGRARGRGDDGRLSGSMNWRVSDKLSEAPNPKLWKARRGSRRVSRIWTGGQAMNNRRTINELEGRIAVMRQNITELGAGSRSPWCCKMNPDLRLRNISPDRTMPVLS